MGSRTRIAVGRRARAAIGPGARSIQSRNADVVTSTSRAAGPTLPPSSTSRTVPP